MASIALVTGASLAWQPRAIREARTLAAAGFNVTVLGSSGTQAAFNLDCELARDNGFSFRTVVVPDDAVPWASVGSFRRRVRSRVGRALFRATNLPTRWQLGTAVTELLGSAMAARADYYIAHTEQGLWAGMHLLKAGRRVGVDMEDWHSQDLLPEVRKERPVALLRKMERLLLCGASHATSPSHAMSEELAKEFGCTPPSVVYNAERWSERRSIDGQSRDRRDRNRPSITWYSQTLGPGRGLEDLFGALSLLNQDVDIHLRGNPVANCSDWLSSVVPESWRRRIIVHDLVPAHELLSRVAEHDIGFAGEMTAVRSRDLTVTNKIMSYLLAGLAVMASDTSGQREVARQAGGAVSLYPSGDAEALARTLDELLADRDRLAAARAAALNAAQSIFCWERQDERLAELVARAIGESPVAAAQPARKE